MSTETVPSPEGYAGTGLSEETIRRLARRNRWLSALIYGLARLIYRTMRVQVHNAERLEAAARGGILVTWHGRTLIPANLFRNRGYWALISLSRDGELQTAIFQRFGFQTVRGSTGRGGVRGALQMARKVREGGVLAFTPDGPRGPTHKVQAGVLLMAEKSGAPILPIGISTSRRWLVKSWDSYLVPKPFARCYVLIGEPIYLPARLSAAEREVYATRIEIAMNRLERDAESLAGHPDYPTEWRTDADVSASDE